MVLFLVRMHFVNRTVHCSLQRVREMSDGPVIHFNVHILCSSIWTNVEGHSENIYSISYKWESAGMH